MFASYMPHGVILGSSMVCPSFDHQKNATHLSLRQAGPYRCLWGSRGVEKSIGNWCRVGARGSGVSGCDLGFRV